MHVLNPKRKINISSHLLWEYDLATFDFDRSAFIVIERVIERGTLEDWREMIVYYGIEKVVEVSQKSKQLSTRDKAVTPRIANSTIFSDVT